MAGTWLVRDSARLRREAWSFLVWGLAFALFGTAVLLWPGLTGRVLVMLVGLVVLAIGLAAVYAAWRLREVAGSVAWAALGSALVVAVVGIVVLLLPEAVTRLVLVVLAVLALLAGLWDLVSGIALAAVARWWLLRALRGVLLVAVAVWVIVTPVSGLVALGWLVAAWAIVLAAVSFAVGILALA